MHNRKILFVGRWRLYEKIRHLIFESIFEIKYASSDRDFDENIIIIVDKAFEKQVRRGGLKGKYNIIDDLDTVELLALLADILSRHITCRDIVIGVDLGPDNSGIALVHCGTPTLHAVLPTYLIHRLVKLLVERGLDVTVCVGVDVKSRDKSRDPMLIMLALSREVPLYVVSERDTKYRRAIFRTLREDLAREGRVTGHELDAVVYALSVDSAIRVRT